MEAEFHIGRPPVVALAGERRRLHLAQEGVHLLGAHLAAGADRTVAGHAGQDGVDLRLHEGRVPGLGEFVENVAKEGFAVHRAEDGRGLADGDGIAAERFRFDFDGTLRLGSGFGAVILWVLIIGLALAENAPINAITAIPNFPVFIM